MSARRPSTGTPPATTPTPVPSARVRHQARDALAVMAFSALTSSVLVLGLLLVSSVGR